MKTKNRNKLAYKTIKAHVGLWSETYLTYESKPLVFTDSQYTFLGEPSLKTIIKAPRRSGKTVAAAALAIWYAETHANSKITILCPNMSLVQAMLRSIKELCVNTEYITTTTNIPSIVEFKNGSSIEILNTANPQFPLSLSLHIDLIIVDEVFQVTQDSWFSITNILENKQNIRLYALGTYEDVYMYTNPHSEDSEFLKLLKSKEVAVINCCGQDTGVSC